MIDYLLKFRKAKTDETLRIMVEAIARKKHFCVNRHLNTYRLTAEYYLNTDHLVAAKVLLAADHREQEINEGRLFDLKPIPKPKKKRKPKA